MLPGNFKCRFNMIILTALDPTGFFVFFLSHTVQSTHTGLTGSSEIAIGLSIKANGCLSFLLQTADLSTV